MKRLAIALIAVAALASSLQAQTRRFATFNCALNRYNPGDLAQDLQNGDPQAAAVAEIIQRVNPDVILLNEFDYDPSGQALSLFRQNYLGAAQDNTIGGNPTLPVRYDYAYIPTSNTGVATGHDLNNDGKVFGADDAHGYGWWEGQYGFAILSKHPIDTANIRTFQKFLWKDMPNSMLPADFYSQDEQDILRLSSKNHVDLPVQIDGRTVHLLASHPTPPVFDGPEDRNGRRNHDEIRFWADYVTPGQGGYIYDDQGAQGQLASGAQFVIAGDLNADPNDGDSTGNPAGMLLSCELINTLLSPDSEGGIQASLLDGGVNVGQTGEPAFDTADWWDGSGGSGNLRADYCLPSANMDLEEAGVFWPETTDELYGLVHDNLSSDHRLVYVDVVVPEPGTLSLLALAGLAILRQRRRR